MAKARTCLWFNAGGEDAVAFYVDLIENSRINAVHRPAPDAPPILIEFTLAGAPYSALCTDGGPEHDAAASVAMVLETQEEADRIYDALMARGGEEVQCGWVTDAWGIRWQVIPEGMYGALFSDDADANAKAHRAMLTMTRLDVAAVEAARQS